MSVRDQYLNAIKPTATSPSWLNALRQQGCDGFAARGFPTARDEEWRYTNVSAIERQPFGRVDRAVSVDGSKLAPLLVSGLTGPRLVFVDGGFSPSLSSLGALPSGASVMPLAQAVEQHADIVSAHLGQQAKVDLNGFIALNTAGIQDGAFVHLKSGVDVADAIQLLFVSTGHQHSAMTQPRNLIIAEDGARATVLEQHVAVEEARYLTNAVTEIFAARGVNLQHYRLQQESMKAYHINALFVLQSGAGEVTSNGIDLGGLLVRNDIASRLSAEQAVCTLNGLYVADGRQHVDNHTRIDHLVPRSASREFYKGVLDGRARAVFTGRVVVHPDAQQTDAEQLNNNLLLSRDAEVDTKPQLEIYADDVKCSHGATVGQLDPDELFYLQARAIDETTARDLLTYAFANDVLTRFKLQPIRAALEHRLTSRLLHGRQLKELELV